MQSTNRSNPGPVPSLEDLTKFWSSEGLKHVIPNVGTEFPEGFDIREVLKNIIDAKSGILEVGCGYGRLCQAFPADTYIGVDVNPAAIEAARQKNPDYRFEQINPADPLPKAGTALVYTVGLHIPDGELERFFAPICAAAPIIVVAEIMDSRWRRPGNPPVYNRDPEQYIQLMARFGYVLQAFAKTIYARYNTPRWKTDRDIRLTMHIYERRAEPGV